MSEFSILLVETRKDGQVVTNEYPATRKEWVSSYDSCIRCCDGDSHPLLTKVHLYLAEGAGEDKDGVMLFEWIGE